MLVSCIILAGGRATRMLGTDKGLVYFGQKPLLQHMIERLTPQVDEIMISANRSLSDYQIFGYPVLKDEYPNFPGPLAGISSGLKKAKYDYLLTVPCDTPLIPLNLAQRLMEALIKENADIAIAKSDGNTQPVISLIKKTLLPNILEYLGQGGRKVSTWQKNLHHIEVDFPEVKNAFINLNTFEEIADFEFKLTHPT